MLEGFKKWRTKRRIVQAVSTALDQHQGLAGKGWPITSDTTAAERQRIAAEVRAWLAAQLPATKMPHGIHGYTVYLGFAHMDGDRRTYLGKQPFPDFTRLEAPAMFETVATAIEQLDLSALPTITLLEVYFFSFGDMIKPTLDEATRL